jgi:hypothetical protein
MNMATYRPMPLGYQAVWLLLMAVIVGSQTIGHYGWPLSSGLVAETVVTIILGAYFWGWIFWKFWLYKKFPGK